MLKVHNVDTGTLCLEVSAVAGRPSHFYTSSDTISPLSLSCSCPSLEWLPFLDWIILHEDFPGPCTGSSLARHTLSQLYSRHWLSPPWNLFIYHLVRSFFLNMYFKIASFFDSLYYICFIFLASITIGHTSYCFYLLLFSITGFWNFCFSEQCIYCMYSAWSLSQFKTNSSNTWKNFSLKTWIHDILRKNLLIRDGTGKSLKRFKSMNKILKLTSSWQKIHGPI